MKMASEFLNTPFVIAISDVLVFIFLMGLMIFFVVGVLGAEGGKLDIKSFGAIKARAITHLKELIVGMLVVILIFTVLKLSGLLTIVYVLVAWAAKGIEAFIQWASNNLPSF